MNYCLILVAVFNFAYAEKKDNGRPEIVPDQKGTSWIRTKKDGTKERVVRFCNPKEDPNSFWCELEKQSEPPTEEDDRLYNDMLRKERLEREKKKTNIKPEIVSDQKGTSWIRTKEDGTKERVVRFCNPKEDPNSFWCELEKRSGSPTEEDDKRYNDILRKERLERLERKKKETDKLKKGKKENRL